MVRAWSSTLSTSAAYTAVLLGAVCPGVIHRVAHAGVVNDAVVVDLDCERGVSCVNPTERVSVS